MQNPLEELRKKYGLTRAQMAAVMDTTPATYGMYARGEAFPSKKKVKLIAEFLGEPYEELLAKVSEYRDFLKMKLREEALKKIKAGR